MIKLSEHPVALEMEAFYGRVRESRRTDEPRPVQFQLGVRIRHLLELDPTAVYHMVGNSTVVYYDSQFARDRDGVGRIVLAPDGRHRRIDTVHIDPRVSA